MTKDSGTCVIIGAAVNGLELHVDLVEGAVPSDADPAWLLGWFSVDAPTQTISLLNPGCYAVTA